jgi:DNA-binding winged helix-turn-helix (wHTH) protein/tetratricopeptide (TPR) repeat protein
MSDAPASFRIDPVNFCLWRTTAAGVEERLDLAPKIFDVLRYLVENSGRLVTHDELLQALWPDVHVQPEVLKSHILAIRTALGDKAANHRFIETQRGRGYRFIGSINGLPSPANRPEAVAELAVFAGRAEPLRELVTSLRRADSGERQAIFISGEAGIGKTALIRQFLAQTRSYPDLVVAHGHCIEGFAGAEPYYPILEAFGGLCKGAAGAGVVRALMSLAPSWVTQMPAQFSVEQLASLRQHILPTARGRMMREACNLIEALAMERPLVLVLEDLHWADFATIDFLSALCRHRTTTKLMLIVTYRPEDLKTARHPLKQMTHDLALRKYCAEIELGPLPEPAIADVLMGGPDGEPVSLDFAQFVKERSGGNPLFIQATLEYLVERGVIARTTRGWRPLASLGKLAFEIPPTLGRVIESKIEGMPDEARRALEAASVAGDHFDPVTTAPAAEMDEESFEAICEGFSGSTCTIRRDELLILPNDDLVRTYSFNHAVYREVLYGRMGQARRARLHRAIGERLEEIYPPGQRGDMSVRLAQHFASARDWPRALDYLRSALRVANNRFARRDALAILDRAAELIANLADSARIPAEIEFLERRGALQAAAHDSEAQETYAQLAEKAGQHGRIDVQCRALLGRSHALSWHDLGHSLRVLDEVLALCDKQTDPIQQDLTRITAYVRRLCGSGWNRTDARNCEEAFIRLKEHGDSLTVARAQAIFSMMCMISTRHREAHDLVDESYRLLDESLENRVEADLARVAWMRHIGVPWSLFSLGEFGGALTEFDASIAAFEKNGDASAAHSLQVYRSVLLFHAMDFEGVLQACRPVAAQVIRPLESHVDRAIRVLPVERRISLILCGLAAMGLGNRRAAAEYLRAAEDEMERQPIHLDWYWRLALEWGMIDLLIADGDRADARARAERLCDLTAQTDERTWQALAWEGRARVALSCGKTSEALEHVVNALAACEGVQVPLAEWRVHATSAATYAAIGDVRKATTHDRRSTATRKRLAETLPQGHPLRVTFEGRSGSSSSVRTLDEATLQ